MQDCISQVFREEITLIEQDKAKSSAKGEISSSLSVSLSREVDFISKCLISEEEKENGLKILAALTKNLKAGNVENIDALLCGYSYFVLNNKCVSDGIAELIELIEAYEKTL